MSWHRTDNQHWSEARESLAGTIEWPRSLAICDLRYLQDVALGPGGSLPSRNTLAKVWGWSKTRVSRLLQDVDAWSDPMKRWAWDDWYNYSVRSAPLFEHPVFRPDIDCGPITYRPRTATGPTPNQSRTVDGSSNADDGAVADQDRTGGGPEAGQDRTTGSQRRVGSTPQIGKNRRGALPPPSFLRRALRLTGGPVRVRPPPTQTRIGSRRG
jgi:hypothetical protein